MEASSFFYEMAAKTVVTTAIQEFTDNQNPLEGYIAEVKELMENHLELCPKLTGHSSLQEFKQGFVNTNFLRNILGFKSDKENFFDNEAIIMFLSLSSVLARILSETTSVLDTKNLIEQRKNQSLRKQLKAYVELENDMVFLQAEIKLSMVLVGLLIDKSPIPARRDDILESLRVMRANIGENITPLYTELKAKVAFFEENPEVPQTIKDFYENVFSHPSPKTSKPFDDVIESFEFIKFHYLLLTEIVVSLEDKLINDL